MPAGVRERELEQAALCWFGDLGYAGPVAPILRWAERG